MKKNKLARAIALASAGVALSFGVVSTANAHAMYNQYTGAGTDGHLVGTFDGVLGNTQWLGTGTPNTNTPFAYSGSQHLNWAAMIHTTASAVEVSKASAVSHYGAAGNALDLDTGGGAWFDGSQGWGHNTDFGLFKSMVDAKLTISVTSLDASEAGTKMAFSIFEGMDTGGSFFRHTDWNSTATVTGTDNPFGTTGLVHQEDVIGTTAGAATTLVDFVVSAGQVYSLYLGGHTSAGLNGYQVNFSASPVPVPAAAWLMGSAVLGLAGMRRKKVTA